MIDQYIIIPGATAKGIYETLLDSRQHTTLISDKAEIIPKEGGKFRAYSGYAIGRITKLIPGKLISLTWRARDWPSKHFSKVSFHLSNVESGAQIHFTQSGLPEGKEAEFESGWQDFYWTPLINYFANI